MRKSCVFAGFALMGLLACGGSDSAEASVEGTDPESLATSPAGAATLAFMDLEAIRPNDANLLEAKLVQPGDLQPAPVTLGCRTFDTVTDATNRTTTVTFTNCVAANGWTLNGTLTVTNPLAAPGVYTSVYDLDSQDGTGTKTWTYSGTKQLTINTANHTASLTVAPGTYLTVSYANTADTTKNKTYHYAPNLSADWATLGQFKLWGSYAFDQVGGPSLTATIAPGTPLIWTPACCFPTSGTIALVSGSATASAVFGPGCGDLKLNGFTYPLECQ